MTGTPPPSLDRALGLLLAVVTLLVAAREWLAPLAAGAGFGPAAGIVSVAILGLLTRGQKPARLIFVAVGLALVAAAAMRDSAWLDHTGAALQKAAFIAAFFTALASLRNAASSSSAIATCGRFLATQPPGRRYAALTVGGHLFGMLLNYGSIVLLGSLAEANAAREPNAEIRGHRIRRMLLAIQRGFISTLPWSPLAFAVAISTALVPGASWAEAVPFCLGSAAILAGTGWALDTIFKPRLSGPPPPRSAPEGDWSSLSPLVALLLILATGTAGLHLSTGVSTVGVVMILVPVISMTWVFLQNRTTAPWRQLRKRVASYATKDLPGYRGELLLLMMAGFIGTLGSRLLAPVVDASGIDLAAIPNWQVLLAIVWLIPVTGQLGMNPILSVSLAAPLLPPAAEMGLTPTDLIVAITAGWALSGASSPFTATTLLIGAFGKVSALHVGLRWNGAYTLVCAMLLSGWVLLVSRL